MDNKSFRSLNNELHTILSRDIIDDNNEVISLDTLDKIISGNIKKYSDVFVVDADKTAKQFNRKTSLNRVFKGEIPQIKTFNPTISDNGHVSIGALFTDADLRYKGQAIIDENCNVDIEFLKEEYSKEKTIAFLNLYREKYVEYINKLMEFAGRYQHVACEWNSSCEIMDEKIDNGILKAHFYLEHPNNASITFCDEEYNEIARSRDIDQHIALNKGRYLKRMPVRIDDLNELYKAIVSRELNLDDAPRLRRIK